MKAAVITFCVFLTGNVLSGQVMGPQTIAQLEESPAGSKILKYVKAINGPDELGEEWVKQLFADALIDKHGAKGLLEMTNNIRNMEGALIIYEVNRREMLKFEIKAKGKSSNHWLDLVFLFEDAHPYPIRGITIDMSDEPSTSTEPLFTGTN